MKCAYIYHLKSGRGNIEKSLVYITNRLKEKYDAVDVFKTISKQDTIQIARKLCYDYDAIIISGGDGTLNNIINGIGPNYIKPVIGIIPAGTANDMARNLSIPRAVKGALDIILDGYFESFSLGLINEHYFIYGAAIGKLSDLSYTTKQTSKKLLGRIAYFIKAFFGLFNFKKENIKVTIDGIIYKFETPLCLVLNSNHIGGIEINPDKNLKDGKYDVYIVKKGKILSIIKLLFVFIFGVEQKSTYKYHYFSTNEITIMTEGNPTWCIDGESGPVGNVVIKKVIPKIKIFVPKE